jgi:hypothetical protein
MVLVHAGGVGYQWYWCRVSMVIVHGDGVVNVSIMVVQGINCGDAGINDGGEGFQ